MILGIGIICLIVSIIGIVMKVKGSYLTCLMWMLSIASHILSLDGLRGSDIPSIISAIGLVITILWISNVNRVMKEVE